MDKDTKLTITKQNLIALCLSIWDIREAEIPEEQLYDFFAEKIDFFATECGWVKE